MLYPDTRSACAQSGMPLSHAHCFQQVANATNCVVASRSVGIYVTGLILANYATKFIAFLPNHPGAYFVKTKGDLAAFFKLVVRDYSIALNPGWQSQLGFSTTPGGNWEV